MYSNPPSNQSFKYDFSHGDYLGLNDFLGSIVCDDLLRSVDVELAVNLLCEKFYHAIEHFIPKQIVYASLFPK